MIINCFKDGFLESLKVHNQFIIDVCDRHIINPFGLGNTNGHSCWWYDPRGQNKLHLTSSYRKLGAIVFPEPDPKVYEDRFCLIMYVPNYPSLFVINKLYEDRKDVLVEDWGSGLSQICYYLTKLGFKNISLIENFQYLAKELFFDFWDSTGIKYLHNDMATHPTVINLVGHHPMPKWYQESCELYCIYEKDTLIADFESLQGYKRLCRDSDGLTNFYARNDKYDEFKAKLEPYKVD